MSLMLLVFKHEVTCHVYTCETESVI